MAHRHGHYENAFMAFLRSHQVPYVPVDEARRAILAGSKVKSFDLLVYPPSQPPWLVDVKGRQFPYVGTRGGRRYWENWVTREDLQGLAEWQQVFGDEFQARFVFVYHLQGDPARWPADQPAYDFDGERYAFLSVLLADYEQYCRPRSDRWQTVSVPAAAFRDIAHPLEHAICEP